MVQIKVSSIGKRYKVYSSPFDRLKDWVMPGENHYNEYWALKDINFEVNHGESIGFIGHNGAGKSTLLKLLTGTIKPTEGDLVINGKVAALLELGMGFHPDFTGIQNVYMTGQLLGLNNQEIDKLLPEIESFAEIGHYINQPLRTYSSGMMVRLGFAVATAVRPDILIVDEALSVGDAYFQHKCFDRIKKYRELGTTLLFVSHDPSAVKNLCDRAILLEKGKQVMDGKPDEVLDYYNAVIAQKEADYQIRQSQGKGSKATTRSGNKKAEIQSVIFKKNNAEVNAVQVGDNLKLNILVKFNEEIVNPTVGFMLRDRLGNEIFGTNTFNLGINSGEYKSGEQMEFSFNFPANLGIGHYSISVAIHSDQTHIQNSYDWWDQATTLQVIPGSNPHFVGTSYLEVHSEIMK
jgi:lipopolysaccharide transport system ATP-binding protein